MYISHHSNSKHVIVVMRYIQEQNFYLICENLHQNCVSQENNTQHFNPPTLHLAGNQPKPVRPMYTKDMYFSFPTDCTFFTMIFLGWYTFCLFPSTNYIQNFSGGLYILLNCITLLCAPGIC